MKPENNKVAITKRFVDGATAPGLYLDGTLKGFRLKVTEAGSKVYQYYGKVKGQPNPVRVTIGQHGDTYEDGTTLTAEKARNEAEKIRGLMRSGVNPNETRKEKAEAADAKAEAEAAERTVKGLTVGKAFEELMEKNQRESTKKGYRSVSTHLKDWLDKPLVDISKDLICERYSKVKRKSPSMAASVMRMLRAAFTTAQIKHGDTIPELARPNPVRILNHTQKGWDTPLARKTYLADESLPTFYQAVMALDDGVVPDFLMIAILTGLRHTEITTLKWGDEVDLRKRTIIIQPERAKNKQRHILWMPDYLYELFLRRWESPLRDSRWVLPGNTPAGHFDDPTWTIEKICREPGIRPMDGATGLTVDRAFTSHDLRRTFSTAAYSLGYGLHEVQRLLNHKGGSVAERHYIQEQAERTKEPMKRISERLLGLMKAEPAEATASNVVPMTKTAG